MTIKITPEAVKERIAALESAGELSLKEQFYLEALRLLVAAMDSEPVADVVVWSHPTEERTCDVRLRHHDVEPGPLYRHAQPAPVAPVCTCPSGDGSLRWPCPVHPGNSPAIPDSSVIGWLRADYQESIKKVGGPLFILGADDPSERWGVKYMPVAKAGEPQNAPQNIPEIIPDSCTWTFSNYEDHWSGTCGAEWVFNDGGPEENGVKFCPKCGKSVAVSATEGTEE